MRENYGTCGDCTAANARSNDHTSPERPWWRSPRTRHTSASCGKTHKELRFPMLNLSPSARKELEAYFADKDRQTIRIFLAPGG